MPVPASEFRNPLGSQVPSLQQPALARGASVNKEIMRIAGIVKSFFVIGVASSVFRFNQYVYQIEHLNHCPF
jgi:hypothetical protein